MNRKELARETAHRTGYTIGVCEEIIKEMFKVMGDTLVAYDQICIPQFGTFEVVERKPTRRYSPTEQQIVLLEASKAVKFRPSKVIKEAVRN